LRVASCEQLKERKKKETTFVSRKKFLEASERSERSIMTSLSIPKGAELFKPKPVKSAEAFTKFLLSSFSLPENSFQPSLQLGSEASGLTGIWWK